MCHDLTWPLAITLLIIGACGGVCCMAILVVGANRRGVRERDTDPETETGSFLDEQLRGKHATD